SAKCNMKIAYLYEYDAKDPATQSSRPHSILKELSRHHKVALFSPIQNISRVLLAPRKLLHLAMGWEHHLEREWLTLHEYAWRAQRFIEREKPDAVFSPSQLIPTYVQTDRP